ncbi:MAG: prepilin peptidase [Lachnospiraceae bacterium]|nr:prepilin peptidase [Lachnospiraceae bacterium]
MLIISSVTDIKDRYVDIRVVTICLILSFVMGKGMYRIPELLTGALPGLMMFVTGKLCKGSIGEGDCILILAAGIMTGLYDTLLILCLSFVFAFIYALLYKTSTLISQKSHSDGIPFAPCLLAGYAVFLFIHDL